MAYFLPFVAFGLIPLAAPPAAGPVGPAGPGVTLVRGKVTAVCPEFVEDAPVGKPSHVATVEVAHVYAGDPRLVGKTFTDLWAVQLGEQHAARAPFRVGEVGLWTVRTGPGGRLTTGYGLRVPFAQRSRAAGGEKHPRHAQHLALAEAIEFYATADPPDRFRVARGLTADPTPEVAAWAVRTIDGYETPEAIKALYDLAAQPGLPLLAQVAIDELLGQRDIEGWVGSKEQEKLLRGWAAGKADQYEATQMLSWLDTATQRRLVPAKLAIELTALASANAGWPREARLEAVMRVGLLGHWAADDDPAFDWLINQARTSPDAGVRWHAVQGLGWVDLFPARLEAVRKCLATEKDEKVRERLQNVLDRRSEKKPPR